MVFRKVLIPVLLLIAAVDVAAQESAPHIRILNPDLNKVFVQATSRSQTLRALADKIEATPVVVYLDCDPYLPNALSGRIGLVASVQEVRYVRIDVRCSLPNIQLIPVLAHELQHAIEIGEAANITDDNSLELYYETVGFEVGRNGAHRAFESMAARDVQQRVHMELIRPVRPAVQPVEHEPVLAP